MGDARFEVKKISRIILQLYARQIDSFGLLNNDNSGI